METIARIGLVFDGLGVAVIVAAALLTAQRALAAWRRHGAEAAYTTARRTLGHGLLLGLEVLIAADLLRTVAVALTLEGVAALGLLVVVRTILSFSVEIEIEGELPWRLRRSAVGGARAAVVERVSRGEAPPADPRDA